MTEGATSVREPRRGAQLWNPEMNLPDFDSDFDVVVLGAGVIGINTAYWALRSGKRVCVIDRTSHGGHGCERGFDSC